MSVTISQNILRKAAELQAFLGFPTWLNFIGVGEYEDKPCIHLYANTRRFPIANIPASWYGLPVKVKVIGKIRPA